MGQYFFGRGWRGVLMSVVILFISLLMYGGESFAAVTSFRTLTTAPNNTSSGPNYSGVKARGYVYYYQDSGNRSVSDENTTLTMTMPPNFVYQSSTVYKPSSVSIISGPTVVGNIVTVVFGPGLGGSESTGQSIAGRLDLIGYFDDSAINASASVSTCNRTSHTFVSDAVHGVVDDTCNNCSRNATAASALQKKTYTNLTDSSHSPGDVLEFTLRTDISDYFGFKNLVVSDTMYDGLTYDATFTPIWTVVDKTGTRSGSFSSSQMSVDISDIGNDANTATNGKTVVKFDVSQALQDDGDDGAILGGQIGGGATTQAYIEVTLRGTINDMYTDAFFGEPIMMYDLLTNEGRFDGYNGSINTYCLTRPSVSIITNSTNALDKEIYAVNGSTIISNDVWTGDLVTYRIQAKLSIADIRNLEITDEFSEYIDMSGFGGTFDPLLAGTIPPEGVFTYGPNDTLHSLGAGLTYSDPLITVGASDFVISYLPLMNDTQNRSATIDLLYTMKVYDTYSDLDHLQDVENLAYGTYDGRYVFNTSTRSKRTVGKDSSSIQLVGPVCGDGSQDNENVFGDFEECDDGNTIDTDMCGNTCKINYCWDDAPLNNTTKSFVIQSLSPTSVTGTSTQPNSEVSLCFEETNGERNVLYTTTDISGSFSFSPNTALYGGPWLNVGVMLHDENGLDIDHHALVVGM